MSSSLFLCPPPLPSPKSIIPIRLVPPPQCHQLWSKNVSKNNSISSNIIFPPPPPLPMPFAINWNQKVWRHHPIPKKCRSPKHKSIRFTLKIEEFTCISFNNPNLKNSSWLRLLSMCSQRFFINMRIVIIYSPTLFNHHPHYDFFFALDLGGWCFLREFSGKRKNYFWPRFYHSFWYIWHKLVGT